MELKVRCRCGRALKIAAKSAGKKLVCPGCGKAFRIPAEKFRAAAAKRPAAAPPQAIPSPAPVPVPLDVQPANLDDQPAPAELDLLGPSAASRSRGGIELEFVAGAAPPPAALPVEPAAPVSVGYASDGRHVRRSSSTLLADAIQGPGRSFWADAFGAFAYPLKNKGNAATLGAITLVKLLPLAVGFLTSLLGGVVGILVLPLVLVSFVVSVVVFFWILVLYLSVVLDSAAGSDELPTPNMTGTILDDLVWPAFKYIGAYLVVFLPAILVKLGIFSGLVPSSVSFLVPIWMVVGAFFIPMTLILFAFDAEGMLLRPDLVSLTIIRTILPYLAIWLMLFLVLGARVLASSASVLAFAGLDGIVPELTGLGTVGAVLMEILDVYSTIVAMRIIGLYYLHFKHRFAIIME